MHILRRHLPFVTLMMVAAPLMLAFTWQRGLASMSDDSFSYLTLARYFAPGASWIDPWAGQHAHLGPLFPLVLMLGGGSDNLWVAHALVALLAVAALAAVYAFAARVLESRWAAVLLVAAFLLTPTAWISIKGILSEPLFLLASLAALDFHASRVDRPQPALRDVLILGVLLGYAYLTRAAGISLLAAYGLHTAWRLAARERESWRLLAAPLPVVLLAAAWWLLRPGDNSGYQSVAVYALQSWADRGFSQVPYAWRLFTEGWTASFHADTTTTLMPTVVFAVVLALALVGAVLRAARNRLDGWYVLLSLAVTFFWMYPQDTTRRLLYPVMPLLLLHAALVVRLAARAVAPAYRKWVYVVASALPLAICVPAMVLLAEKALVRERVAGTAYAYPDITEYFLFVNEAQARAFAGRGIATFAGFDGVATSTPADAKVMWVRPEYVAMLANRAPVAYENRWDSLTLAREIARTGTGYVIFAEAYKADVNISMRHPREVLADVPSYSREVFAIANPVTRLREFALYEIDRARLQAFIAAGKPGA